MADKKSGQDGPKSTMLLAGLVIVGVAFAWIFWSAFIRAETEEEKKERMKEEKAEVARKQEEDRAEKKRLHQLELQQKAQPAQPPQ